MGGVIRNKVACVVSGALTGFNGDIIEVEADLKAGLPSLQIVGMGNKAIDEARPRVRSAIINSLLTFPAQKITINLAPAELPKDGTHLDIPIALSILVASGQLKQSEVDHCLFVGELALDGSIRPIRGAAIFAELAKQSGMKRCFVPLQNIAQAHLVQNIDIIGVSSLMALYKALKGVGPFETSALLSPTSISSPTKTATPSFDSIIGHEQAKRALTIAAAGRHNILFSGSPGAGKTLLAKSLITILPPLSPQEILEVTKLHSLASGDTTTIHTTPPFRAPHHSVTLSALIGGGLRPRPGDISLAHKGVLFLDELPEYPKPTLEALRQPLEDGIIHLSRLYGHVSWPSDFVMVATMNPCPCGYAGDPSVTCTCSPVQISQYNKRVSGPLLDRIDLRLTVQKAKLEHIFNSNVLNNNQQLTVTNLISIARKAQAERYKCSSIYNSNASLQDAQKLFDVTAGAWKLLNKASTSLDLSSRGYVRVLRVARTIADLENAKDLNEKHIAEALQFR